ncbi:MAG: hypothetical protein ACOX4H_04740 [Bacillota bacterium]|jgi:hypothetical protein
MKKITDRFTLGIISGLCGNIAKRAVEKIFYRTGFSTMSSVKTAAGIFLRKSDVSSPYGKIVGTIADNMIAAGLGVTCAYWLSFMGKDKAFLKGCCLGVAEWAALYGVLSKFGATAIFPVPPKDALVSSLSHAAFGTTKILVATKLGDERLFKPKNLTLEINNAQNLFPKQNSDNSTEAKPDSSLN